MHSKNIFITNLKHNMIVRAWLLLLLILFMTIPKEVIHELHECNDTKDVYYEINGRLQFSSIHHHCEVFQLEAPQLGFFTENPISFKVVFKSIGFIVLKAQSLPDFNRLFFLRGPPEVN